MESVEPEGNQQQQLSTDNSGSDDEDVFLDDFSVTNEDDPSDEVVSLDRAEAPSEVQKAAPPPPKGLSLPCIATSRFPGFRPEILASAWSEPPERVVKLISPFTGAQVYLVGTAHVSRQSSDDVREAIRLLRPSTVVVELCNDRVAMLFAETQAVPPTLSAALAHGSSGLFLYLLASMYHSVRDQLKVTPGMEFQTAFAEARRQGSLVVLGDRPIQATMRRTWASMSAWDKVRFVWAFLAELNMEIKAADVERLKQPDLLTEMVEEFSRTCPSVVGPLLHERDLFLAAAVRTCPGSDIVAVVGLGHVEGIVKHWAEPIDHVELLRLPEPWKYSRWVVAGVLVAVLTLLLAVVYLLYTYCPMPIPLLLYLVFSLLLIHRSTFHSRITDHLDAHEENARQRRERGALDASEKPKQN